MWTLPYRGQHESEYENEETSAMKVHKGGNKNEYRFEEILIQLNLRFNNSSKVAKIDIFY